MRQNHHPPHLPIDDTTCHAMPCMTYERLPNANQPFQNNQTASAS